MNAFAFWHQPLDNLSKPHAVVMVIRQIEPVRIILGGQDRIITQTGPEAMGGIKTNRRIKHLPQAPLPVNPSAQDILPLRSLARFALNACARRSARRLYQRSFGPTSKTRSPSENRNTTWIG